MVFPTMPNSAGKAVETQSILVDLKVYRNNILSSTSSLSISLSMLYLENGFLFKSGDKVIPVEQMLIIVHMHTE